MTTKTFINLCKMTQGKLKDFLEANLENYGYEVINGDGYLLAPGREIVLTAHMDTVHKKPVTHYVIKEGRITSPQGIGGDDRCGVFIILSLLEKGYRPTVLFCEDEEIGCVGAEKFVAQGKWDLSDHKYIVELDRRGSNDCVFYSCDNDEFIKYIEKVTGYKEAYGTCSDISILAPAFGIAAVNLSCGYYNEHTLIESVVWNEMINTVEATARLLDDASKAKQYEYIEAPVYYRSQYYTNKYNSYDYYDDYYDNYYDAQNGSGYWELWYMEGGEEHMYVAKANSFYEIIGKFLTDHPNLTYNGSVIDAFER